MKFSERARDALRGTARSMGYAIVNLPFANRLPRFSHYSRRYTPLILVGSIGWSYIPVHGDPWWWRIASALFTYVLVYAVWAGISHTARLCEYCVREFPVNGPELAARCRRRLWINHFQWKRWLFGPMAVGALIIYAGPHIGLRGTWNTTAQVPPLLAFAWAQWRYFLTHDRLAAWCPWCRHNRPPEDASTPAPDPVEGKPVPV